MDFDSAELEGYRGVYAQALVQLRKDLSAPVQQLCASVYGSNSPVTYDWYLIVISHLTALDRDRRGIHPLLFVPDLASAVRLWMRGALRDAHMTGDGRRDTFQYEVNHNIALRLDAVYGHGDPLLAAVCVYADPEMVREFALNTGLPYSKAVEVEGRFLAQARPIADRAWQLFSHRHPPCNVSMFRPLRRDERSGSRKFFR